MSEPATHPIFVAIETADMDAIERLAAAGVDLNMRDSLGEPALFSAVVAAEYAEDEGELVSRLAIISKLLDLGADLEGLDEEGGSILIGPIFGQRTNLVESLLRLGVDPNHGCCEASETVYDAASFDYYYEAYVAPYHPYPDPPDNLAPDEDAFVAWLDREAEARGYLRPDILILLRKHGALTGREIAAQLGGKPDQPVRWTEGKWALA